MLFVLTVLLPLTSSLVASSAVAAIEAKHYGGTGEIVFQIPDDRWKPKPPEPKKPRK